LMNSDHPSLSNSTDTTSTTLASQADKTGHLAGSTSGFVDLRAMKESIIAAMIPGSSGLQVSRATVRGIIANYGLKAILAQDTSLRSMPSLPYTKFDVDQFAADVEMSARILLAICVLIDAGFGVLKGLMTLGLTDADLPLTSSVLDSLLDCPQSKRVDFMKWQYAFTPEEDAQQIIQYVPRVQVRTRNDGDVLSGIACVSPTLLGEGAFGRVYKTSIQRDHWDLRPEQKERVWATKCFVERDESSSYQREIENLRELDRNPHRNLLPHVASWRNDGLYYIMFPLANMNVRQMTGLEPPYGPIFRK